MLLHLDFSLPFKSPVLTFGVMLLVMLLIPIFLKKIKIPSIIGLILAGTLLGGYGLGVLEQKNISLLSNAGLLYLMFLAGLEIDMHSFGKNRRKSFGFGFFTFVIPLTLGFLTCYYLLEFNFLAALLVASMFSTHTLLAYPIAIQLDITKTEIVTIAIGGTIITDVAVLLMLSIISAFAKGNPDWVFWSKFTVSLVIFGVFVLWILPKISRWFFKYFLQGEAVLQYVYVLAAVLVCGIAAELAGMEAIIGAFFAGLALNSLIPHTSALMNRIIFVGNAIFIPFFLIGVGMVVNLGVLFNGFQTIFVAAVLTSMALLVKYLAAWATQKAFGYHKVERNVLFGLSSSHAAATLAVIFIGYDLKLFGDEVLNGTIILILITSMVSSFVTETQGKKLAIMEHDKSPNLDDLPDRLLVLISNPATIETLVDFAVLLKNHKSKEAIHSLSIVIDDEKAQEQLITTNRNLQKAVQHASSSEQLVETHVKIEIDVPTGVSRAAKELLTTQIIMGWNAQMNSLQNFFGTILDKILSQTTQMIWVARIQKEIHCKRCILVMPPHGEMEAGFGDMMIAIKQFAKHSGIPLYVIYHSGSPQIPEILAKLKPETPDTFATYHKWQELDEMTISQTQKDDFLIIVNARPYSISHAKPMERIPKILAKNFSDYNFAIVYPSKIN